MELQEIFSVQEHHQADNKSEFLIAWNEQHEIYKGHFPNQPITPGVILMELCLRLINQVTEKKWKLSSAKSLKFVAPVLPQNDLKISLENKKENQWLCVGSVENQTVFKFSIEVCAA